MGPMVVNAAKLDQSPAEFTALPQSWPMNPTAHALISKKDLMMLKPSRLAVMAAILSASAALGLFTFAPAAMADEKVIAKIDGQPVTEQELAIVIASMAQQTAQLPEPAKRRAALDRLIDMRILSNRAAKDGLDQSAEFKRRLDSIRQQLLINEFVRVKVEGMVTDEMVKARYDKDAANFNAPEEIRARHILVKTKDEAVAIIADLAKGGDFAKIATEKSQDPGSAKEGGDLGYFASGEMVQPFEDAASKLKVGDYTKEPVETQFGFHVIKLEDKRKQKIPGFEDVKDQIRQAVLGERFTTALADLKKDIKIEIDEQALATKP